MDEFTFSLFAKPSFVEGVGRILDFGGSMSQYNSSTSGQEADFRALSSDWRAIGEDMSEACKGDLPAN